MHRSDNPSAKYSRKLETGRARLIRGDNPYLIRATRPVLARAARGDRANVDDATGDNIEGCGLNLP